MKNTTAFSASSYPLSASKPAHVSPMIVVCSLFLFFGFTTTLNDSVIPYLQSIFSLDYRHVMLIQLVFFSGYFIAPLISVYFIDRFGYKKTIIGSMLTCSMACLALLGAASYFSYSGILAAFYLLGSGIAFLQVAGNAYAVLLGKSQTASSRLTFAHAFNSVGTVIAPLVGAFFILRAHTSASENHLLLPYAIFCVIWLGLCLVTAFFSMPLEHAPTPRLSGSYKIILKNPQLLLGFGGIFLYVGAEVSIGSFLVKFLQDPNIMGFSAHQAGNYLAIYWGGQMLGRFLGAFNLRHFRPSQLLSLHAFFAAALVTIAVLASGSLAMIALLAVGLCNSIMFPTIFSLTLNALGKYQHQASGILSIGCAGGALVPMLQAFFADTMNLQFSFIVPVFCYLYITGLALSFWNLGHKSSL